MYIPMAQGVVVKNPLGAVENITVLVVILSQSGVRICTYVLPADSESTA